MSPLQGSSYADFAEAIRGGAIVLFPRRKHALGELPDWLIERPIINTDSRLVQAVSAALGRAVVCVAFREDGGIALGVEDELPDHFETYAELQRLAGGAPVSRLWIKKRSLWYEISSGGHVLNHFRTLAEAERAADLIRRADVPREVTIRPCTEFEVGEFRTRGTRQ